MKKVHQEARIENVYQLEGRVPVGKAIPFGLQHVLAMFVANIAPLIIIASVAVYNGQAFTTIETAQLLQNCMLIAGIGTLIQLYPIWKIGSGLPVVMGLSFTFLAGLHGPPRRRITASWSGQSSSAVFLRASSA